MRYPGVTLASLRLKTWNAFHRYIDQCQRYGALPDIEKIINTLLPPDKPVELFAVLPGRF